MEELENGKSANQLWKESGTTLSFADWIEREKGKGRFLPNKMLEGITDSIKSGLGFEPENLNTITKKDKSSVMGLSKPILMISALIIIGAIGYSIYQKRK